VMDSRKAEEAEVKEGWDEVSVEEASSPGACDPVISPMLIRGPYPPQARITGAGEQDCFWGGISA
jgi:hypothetical protein